MYNVLSCGLQLQLYRWNSEVINWHLIARSPNYRSYRKLSNIRRAKSQNINDSRLVLHLSLPNLSLPNEDVVGAAPTGDAPTTSEWSTIQLPTNVRLILKTWR